MFKFFSFKKKRREKEGKVTPQIINKLDQIIELLQQKKNETEAKNIHFEHVQINHLESIIFHLDNIEIDELSGKLVIGNNIRTSEDLAKPLMEKMNKEDAQKAAISEDRQEKVVKTSTGYRIRKE